MPEPLAEKAAYKKLIVAHIAQEFVHVYGHLILFSFFVFFLCFFPKLPIFYYNYYTGKCHTPKRHIYAHLKMDL